MLIASLAFSLIAIKISAILMYKVSEKGGKNAKPVVIAKPFILGGLSFFIFLDTLSYLCFKKSFTFALFSGGHIYEMLVLSLILLAIGMAFDFAGIYLTKLWEYPPVTKNKLWYLAYGPMWIIYCFCMQLFWVFIQNLNMGFFVNLLLVSLIGYLCLEIINRYGSAWVYRGILKKPLFLYLGWITLTIFCAILPALLINPLGLVF